MVAWISVFLCCVGVLFIQSASCSPSDGRIDRLSSILKSVRAKNARLFEQIEDFQRSINNERSDIQSLTKKLEQVQDDYETQRQQFTEEDSDTDQNVQMYSEDKRQLNSPTVCFSAVISQADLTNLNAGTPVVFDQVITNVGQGYNATSGEFRAPISGLYVLNMDIMVMAGENEYLQFVKDDAHVLYNYAHASGALHDESSSRLVVINLKNGNRVWVRTAPGAHHGSGNLHGNGFSTFSGWLLAVTE